MAPNVCRPVCSRGLLDSIDHLRRDLRIAGPISDFSRMKSVPRHGFKNAE
jgi:hypothetical protein